MSLPDPGLPRATGAPAPRPSIGFKNPLSRVVLAVAAVLTLAGLVLHAVNLKLLHDDAVAAAETETRNLANVLAEHTERVFDGTDRALLAVVNLHDQILRGEPLGPAHVHEVLKQIQDGSEILRRLTWTDASGRRVATSAENRPRDVDFSTRTSFRVHQSASDIGMYITHPFKPADDDRPWLIGISRRLNRSDGTFDGIAMGLLDPDYFVALYRSIDIGRTRAASLITADGTILARGANDRLHIGQSIADRALFRKYLPKARRGTYTAVSPLDHTTRIISYASVKNYPLVITIAVAQAEALASWRRQLLFTSAGLAAFLALLLGLAYLLVRQLERDAEHRQLLVTARREAVAANRAKSAFLSHMSHELRTPLNAIIGFAELIRDRFDAHRAAIHGYADEIHSAGTHLLELINDMLDLAKIEAQRRDIEETVVDLHGVAERVLRLHAPAAEKAGVGLNLDLAPALPRLVADERAVVQMLNNLLSNAIKFTPAGGRVDLRGAATAREVTLTVSDTGIGIAPEDQKRVFERFGRSTDPLVSTPQGGTGLGLAIVKGLIELHGGRVTLTSARGQGTDVTLRFPASRIASGRAAA